MADMAKNMTMAATLPPLPKYTLESLPPLIAPIPDVYLTLLLPILAYWGLSMVFHLIDTFDLFPQYRLHTPAEVLKRNHVSRWEVVRDVVIQQIVQTIVGIALTWFDPEQETGMDDYNVILWAQRVRITQSIVPTALGLIGLDAHGLASKATAHSATLAGALNGGQYPWLVHAANGSMVANFAPWELLVGKLIYWVVIPALQFAAAILIVDTWQYFLHRAMHMNRWLYTTFHSRHHRLYVPYAYGALYNHPFEGFLLDTLGTSIAYLATGMTVRQSMWFFTGSTFKTVDDHCGYSLPWDPLQHLTSNNAGYHDVHHQSWGIKTNFSQPFFTFWDRLLGTVWTGGDVSARYERSRLAAQRKIDQDSKSQSPVTGSIPMDSILAADNKAPYSESTCTKLTNSAILPQVPTGKAAVQASDSRKQVLSDRHSAAGGSNILAEETAEEEREASCLPMSVRPGPGKNGSNGSGTGLKGLTNRVRKGSLLGSSS